MKFGAIVPAYNAENEIQKTIAGIKIYLNDNIIVIDDGSKDRTAKIARKSKVIVLSHKHNRGKGAALKTGFERALSLNWDAVITIDADGQHDPRFIPKFIDVYKGTHFNVIIGSRMRDLSIMPFHRKLSNKMTSALVSLRIGQKIDDSQSGYRIIDVEVIKNINLHTDHYDTETEIILRSGLKGYKIGFIDINTIYSTESSSIRIFLDTWRFIKLYWSSWFWLLHNNRKK